MTSWSAVPNRSLWSSRQTRPELAMQDTSTKEQSVDVFSDRRGPNPYGADINWSKRVGARRDERSWNVGELPWEDFANRRGTAAAKPGARALRDWRPILPVASPSVGRTMFRMQRLGKQSPLRCRLGTRGRGQSDTDGIRDEDLGERHEPTVSA